MALQSQTLRGSSNVRSSGALDKANRSGSKRVVGLALLVLIVGAGFIYLVRSRDGGGAAGLGPQQAKADGSAASGMVPPLKDPIAAATPVATASTPPVAPKVEPTVLEMGGRTRPSNATTPTNTLPAFTNATKPISIPSGTPTSGAAGAAATTQTAPGAVTPPPPTATPMVRDPLASTQPDGSGLPGELAAVQGLAERAIAEKRLVEARAQLNKILVDPRVGEKDRDGIRKWMSDLNKELVFSANAFPNDPMVDSYKVEKGDSLIKISRKVNSVTESGFIQRVNGVSPSALRVGQQLKIVKGPFHAVVSKSAFRMDIYEGPSVAPSAIGGSNLAAGAEPGWIYICSFPVGLGEKGVTPVGAFTVKDGSKLINPPWVNPRTGEKFDKDDPKNPIGERWIGLLGLDEKTKAFTGYGIHGTVAPESIGKEMSMGCVRMNAADVEVVYEMLMGRSSVVKIVP